MKLKSGLRIENVLIALILILGLVTSDIAPVFAKTVSGPASKLKNVPNVAASVLYLGNLGTVSSKSSATQLQITTEQAVNAGNDIFVALGTDPNSSLTVTVTDSAGNTYSQVRLEINSGNIRTYLFAAFNVNPMPAGSKITLTMSVAVTAQAALAVLFDGLADLDQLDQLASANATSTSSPSSGATSTTSQADELLIGVIGTEGPMGDASGSWENAFMAGPRTGTTGGTDDTNITISLGYRIVSSTGAYTSAKTGITARDWGAIIGTFRADTGTDQPRVTLTGALSDFSCVPGGVSAEQTYKVSGSNLTEDIRITAPTDFKVSLSSGSGFLGEITLPQSGGSVVETPVYVRYSKATEGTSTGTIQHVSAGATARAISVKGISAPLNPVNFNIVLGRPTDHSITANIITDYDAEFYVDYGDASGTYTHNAGPYNVTGSGTSPSYPINPIEIVIDGLAANARHYYRIRYRRTGITEWNLGAENSFMTQRAPGQPFVFTVISDSHLGQYGGQTADELDLYRNTIQNVIADNPDFHIDTGDTFAMDPSPLGTGMTDAEASAAYYVERPFLGPLTDSAPFFFVIGNHENEEGWNFDDVFTAPDQSLAKVGMKYRKLMYPNPVPNSFYSGNTDPLSSPIGGDTNQEDYWAWQWGDALFVVLDPYHYSMKWPNDDGANYGGEGQDGEASGDRWDWSLGIKQYLWFKQTLENSTAKFKFVFTHQVTGGTTPYGRGGKSAVELFEWGGKNADGSWGWDTHRPASQGWTKPVHQLMVDNGVDIFFHGHDHNYAYEEVDGIAYVEIPKPDDAGYTWQPYSYGYNENLYPEAQPILQNSGHIRVSVGTNQVLVEYVRSYLPGDGSNGSVSHSFTVPLDEPENKLGDVNGDGEANSTDALVVLSGDAGINIKTFCPINCGDANGDGLVNSTDALIMLSFDVGMSIPYSLEQAACPLTITPPQGCTLP